MLIRKDKFKTAYQNFDISRFSQNKRLGVSFQLRKQSHQAKYTEEKASLLGNMTQSFSKGKQMFINKTFTQTKSASLEEDKPGAEPVKIFDKILNEFQEELETKGDIDFEKDGSHVRSKKDAMMDQYMDDEISHRNIDIEDMPCAEDGDERVDLDDMESVDKDCDGEMMHFEMLRRNAKRPSPDSAALLNPYDVNSLSSSL